MRILLYYEYMSGCLDFTPYSRKKLSVHLILSPEGVVNSLMVFFKEERRAKIRQMLDKVTDENEQVAYLRARAIGLLTYECTQAFLQHEEEILAGEFEGELIEHISELPRQAYQHCAELAKQKIYRSRDVVDIEVAGFRIIGTLIDLMTDAVLSPEKAYSQLLMNRVSSQYSIRSAALFERILSVLDYISGMTDVFALDLYRKINGNSLSAV